jgi:Zn2+/Cd2+-exporting ATPase
MDCAEEVAVLKREIGPVVGNVDRLVFDILKGNFFVLASPRIAPGHQPKMAEDRSHSQEADSQ